MISNINYGVYRGKRTVSLCRCTHLNVLGHSSIETMRIYLVISVAEHRRQLERLRLVS